MYVMRSVRRSVSISGHHTFAPVALATGATAPMWSKWQWVSRIASSVDARALHGRDEALGLLARVDHDRGARVGGGAHEVAVLLQRRRR